MHLIFKKRKNEKKRYPIKKKSDLFPNVFLLTLSPPLHVWLQSDRMPAAQGGNSRSLLETIYWVAELEKQRLFTVKAHQDNVGGGAAGRSGRRRGEEEWEVVEVVWVDGEGRGGGVQGLTLLSAWGPFSCMSLYMYVSKHSAFATVRPRRILNHRTEGEGWFFIWNDRVFALLLQTISVESPSGTAVLLH